MRDIIITVMVFATIPYILRNPWYGVLTWSWLSYMNPHRLAWGFAYTMPFAQIVAIILLISLVISKDKKRLPANSLVVVWVIFLVWLSISTIFAVYPDLAVLQLQKVLKIQLVTFVTLMLMRDFERVNQLIWVIVFSIGFYSVKGGIFTIMTGGGYHVFGPDGSDIQENNALAVAVLMIIPLMIYLYRYPPRDWVRKIMPYCILFSLASVIGSQSRGAVLAILAVGAFFWWKTKSKLLTAMAFVVLATLVVMFMPQSWHDRVNSISEYQQDSSSMERIRAWEYSIAIANDRLTGGGFASWSPATYYQYEIWSEKAFVAHSIYFSVLNDGGWPGLFIFLLILFLMWRQLHAVIKITANDPERADYNFLARMLQISIVAFLAGGAFLSLAYFDLAWHFMAITVALNHLARNLYQRERVVSVRRGVRALRRPRGELPIKP
jgi:probable O-glycosylation ligase (exosortase A-associated)